MTEDLERYRYIASDVEVSLEVLFGRGFEHTDLDIVEGDEVLHAYNQKCIWQCDAILEDDCGSFFTVHAKLPIIRANLSEESIFFIAEGEHVLLTIKDRKYLAVFGVFRPPDYRNVRIAELPVHEDGEWWVGYSFREDERWHEPISQMPAGYEIPPRETFN